ARPAKPPPKSKGKAKAKSPQTSHAGPFLPRGSSNGIHSLPTVGIRHRHRAVTLYFPVERVERLTPPAKLFAPPWTTPTDDDTGDRGPRTTPTNNLTFNRRYRIMFIGAGDAMLAPSSSRSFWGTELGAGKRLEPPKCRPRIHTGITVDGGWELVDQQTAFSFLPSDDVAADDGALQASPHSICSLGRRRKQTRTEVPMFKARRMCTLFPVERDIFLAALPVWGIYPEQREAPQYLAVTPLLSRLHSPNIGTKLARPSKVRAQIWSLSPTKKNSDIDDDAEDPGRMCYTIVLCTERTSSNAVLTFA
ncbi:hypothetical protein FIBSPDRAFT_747150, partial [Athelia psychrophila]